MTRVLVVEDSAALAGWAETLLASEADIEVRVRTLNFAGLLDPADPDWVGVDVLLCDYMLPDMTGDAIMAVAAAAFPDMRNILYTAWKDAPSQHASMVLLKPTSIEGLLDAVRGTGP